VSRLCADIRPTRVAKDLDQEEELSSD